MTLKTESFELFRIVYIFLPILIFYYIFREHDLDSSNYCYVKKYNYVPRHME